MDGDIELLDIGVRWRNDYYQHYGNPSESRVSNAFDTCTERTGPIYCDPITPSTLPVLKYGKGIAEVEKQEINWGSGTRHINYSSAYQTYKADRQTNMQLDKEILGFETPKTTDMILRKRAESAYVKLSPFFKTLCQCIPDDNEMLVRYVNHKLHDITNTIIQKLLEESGGNDTFAMLSLFLQNYLLLQGSRN